MPRLSTVTTKETENSAIIVVEMKEVILVDTQTVSVPPAANMQSPDVNAATVSTGVKSLQPATNLNAAALPPLKWVDVTKPDGSPLF
jgi:hypothetical protein